MLRPVLTLGFVALLVIVPIIHTNFVFGIQNDSNITLTILLNRGRILIDNSLAVLRNETDTVINVKYLEFPYNSTVS